VPLPPLPAARLPPTVGGSRQLRLGDGAAGLAVAPAPPEGQPHSDPAAAAERPYRATCSGCHTDVFLAVVAFDGSRTARPVRCPGCKRRFRPSGAFCLICAAAAFRCRGHGVGRDPASAAPPAGRAAAAPATRSPPASGAASPAAAAADPIEEATQIGEEAERASGSATAAAAGAVTLFTDYSGMDMAAFALKQLVPDFVHLQACDIWPVARAFCQRNHGLSPGEVFDAVETRPLPQSAPPSTSPARPARRGARPDGARACSTRVLATSSARST